MLWAWMVRARHRFPDAPAYFAAPDHRNERSLRMLDKAGFVRGLWFDEPEPDGVDDDRGRLHPRRGPRPGLSPGPEGPIVWP